MRTLMLNFSTRDFTTRLFSTNPLTRFTALMGLFSLLLSTHTTAQYVYDEPYSDHEYYFSFGYNLGTISASGFDANPSMIVGTAGINITPADLYWFSVEFRAGGGTGQVEWTDVTDVGFQTLLGVYGRGSVALTEQITAYGFLGYNEIEITTKTPLTDSESTDSDTDISYGLGAQFHFNNHHAMLVEYHLIYDDRMGIELSTLPVKMSSFQIGWAYRFF